MLTNDTQLDNHTTPSPNKATDSLLSSSNTELMDARCDPKQQILKMTKSESNDLIKSNNVLSPTQENLATDRTTEHARELRCHTSIIPDT